MAKEKEVTLTKEEKLQLVVSQLNKDHGVGTILLNQPLPGVEKFSSGSLTLDIALGGGWARGRIVEIYGKPSAGKTSLALQAIAEIQNSGGVGAFVDIEHAFDPKYAETIGVNLETLVFSQPDYGEQALAVVEGLVDSGTIDLIVIDSVAALVPKVELDGEMEDQQMGLQGRLMSKAMRKLTAIVSKNRTTVMFLNQLRAKITMYGGGQETSGGNALKFYASQRLELQPKSKALEEGGEKVATEVLAKVVKNKVAPPFKEATLTIRYGVGLDRWTDLLRFAVSQGLIEKKGAGWYTYNNSSLAQGEGNSAAYIRAHPELEQELKQKLL
jgi:recombination protein RecA